MKNKSDDFDSKKSIRHYRAIIVEVHDLAWAYHIEVDQTWVDQETILK